MGGRNRTHLTANGKDMYGIVFTSTVTTAYGFIIGQDIKA